MGRLERKLDLDLIARIEAGNRFKPEPLKKQKPRRPWWTYRAAWRNILREKPEDERGIAESNQHPSGSGQWVTSPPQGKLLEAFKGFREISQKAKEPQPSPERSFGNAEIPA